MILGFSNSVLCEITEDVDELTQATGFCAALSSEALQLSPSHASESPCAP